MPQIRKISLQGSMPAVLTSDGEYLVDFRGELRSRFVFAYEGVSPKAGFLTCDFQGSKGEPEAELDLSADENTFSWDNPVPEIHIELTGLPSGSKILFYCSRD